MTKVNAVVKVPELIEQVKLATMAMQDARNFMCEGLLATALANPQAKESRDSIRFELGAISGGIVTESKILPQILEAARKLIG